MVPQAGDGRPIVASTTPLHSFLKYAVNSNYIPNNLSVNFQSNLIIRNRNPSPNSYHGLPVISQIFHDFLELTRVVRDGDLLTLSLPAFMVNEKTEAIPELPALLPVDMELADDAGLVQRKRDALMCKHGDQQSCIHCVPLEPFDELVQSRAVLPSGEKQNGSGMPRIKFLVLTPPFLLNAKFILGLGASSSFQLTSPSLPLPHPLFIDADNPNRTCHSSPFMRTYGCSILELTRENSRIWKSPRAGLLNAETMPPGPQPFARNASRAPSS